MSEAGAVNEVVGVRRRRPPLVLVVLATVAVLAALVAVLTPRGESGGPALSSAGAGARGVLGLYDALGRLGWRPERDSTPPARTGADAVYVAVRQDHGVYDTVAGRVLRAVREGAGLVVDVRPGDPLSDSLGLVLTPGFVVGYQTPIDNAAATARLDAGPALARPGCRRADSTDLAVATVGAGTRYVSYGLADSGAATHPGRRVFLDVPAQDSASPAVRIVGGTAGSTTRTAGLTRQRAPVVVGFPYGRGRVVATADASVLTNAALRTCWAVAGPMAVRAFEWVSAGVPAAGGARPRVVFFEGVRDPGQAPRPPSVARAVRRALTEVPAGRAVTQLVAAGLVLLAAAGVRALPPEPSPRVARRSPFEHVGALARAYREARASRVAARRLAAGLRRRYGGTGAGFDAPRAASTSDGPAADADARFLAGVALRHPGLAADAARLRAALVEPVPPAEVVLVGEAARRIARALDAARRGATA